MTKSFKVLRNYNFYTIFFIIFLKASIIILPVSKKFIEKKYSWEKSTDGSYSLYKKIGVFNE